jgi:hypothetical protein
MPTVLFIRGWRLFFYFNERNEPPHIHVQKGGADGKYWLRPEVFDVIEAFSYGMSPADQRAIRQIMFEHFDYLVSEYERFHRGES